jgi:hypothetical protein
MASSDFYEDGASRAANRQQGIPDVGIDSCSTIEGTMIDKNARIGHNVIIRPHPEVVEVVETENADFTFSSPLMSEEYQRLLPDYETYRTRRIVEDE